MGRPKGSFKSKEPLSEKQKIAKKIGTDGEDILRELEAADVEALNKRIAQANQAISETKDALEADLPNGDKSPYMKAKEQAKDYSADFRDVKKRQNAIIALAVEFRKEKGTA